MSPTPVKVTQELATNLWHATCDHMHHYTQPGSNGPPDYAARHCLVDDTGDDWTAIVTLMSIMHQFNEDGYWNAAYMEAWLNAPEGETVPHTGQDGTQWPNLSRLDPLRDVGGCDGIPQAFYDLDCPALPRT